MRNSTSVGDATIIQGNKPLDFYLRNQQLQGQSAYRQAQLQRQQDAQNNQTFQQLMKTDFSKPGEFQKEESVKEINGVSDLARKSAYNNPYATLSEHEQVVGPVKDEVRRRIEKRNSFDTEMARNQALVKAHPNRYNLDPATGLPAVLHNTFRDENGGHIDIDKLDPEQVDQVFNSPAVVNPDVRTADAVEHLKNRFANLELGPEQASALGFFREGAFQKARFMTKDAEGNLVPGVSPELIDYVKHVDPTIPQGFMWKQAQAQAVGAGLDPKNFNAVNEIYNNPKFQEDNAPIVDQQIKNALDMHQQAEHREIIQRTGTRPNNEGKEIPTPDDYSRVHQQIKNIQDLGLKLKDAIAKQPDKNHPIGTEDYEQFIKSPEVQAITNTIKNGKYKGMEVLDAKPDIQDGEPGIAVKLKLGTQQEADYTKSTAERPDFIKLNDAAGLFDVLKNNYSEKKAKQMNWNAYEDFKKGQGEGTTTEAPTKSGVKWK